jgi:hypothetical protein
VRVVFPLQFIVGFALLLPGTFPVLAETAPAPAVPTECDRLAAHPSDPDKLTEGVPTAQVRGWNDAAIWSCRQAVTRDAGDARQRYQLGRALFYAGERKEALEQLAIAAAAKYRQAQFVRGLMHSARNRRPRRRSTGGWRPRGPRAPTTTSGCSSTGPGRRWPPPADPQVDFSYWLSTWNTRWIRASRRRFLSSEADSSGR